MRAGSRSWAWLFASVFVLGFVSGAPKPLIAQDTGTVRSAILTIDSDRVFAESLFGKRIAVELQAKRSALEAENGARQAELEQEERDLTQKRSELAPEEFRVLADAFDAKVQRIRAEQGSKAQDLQAQLEVARRRFLEAARVALGGLMQESGAAVLLEQRSVFMSDNFIDISQVAIERINESLGDGSTINDTTLPDSAVKE